MSAGTAVPVRAVSLRLLSGASDEMAALQRVIEGAPRYAHLVTGLPPGAADAQSTYSILPPGKSYDDKFVLGIFDGSEMIGCVDLIRGYPDAVTAYLGLLLLAEPYEGQGIGARAYQAVESFVRAWGCCTRIKLGVVRENERALRFWTRLGFEPTREIKPYRNGCVASATILFDKALAGEPR